MFSYSTNYRKGTVDFTLPTERRTFPLWRFLFSSISSAVRDVEFIQDSDDKKISVWTETRLDGELIAISAMSNTLARLAGVSVSRVAQTAKVGTSPHEEKNTTKRDVQGSLEIEVQKRQLPDDIGSLTITPISEYAGEQGHAPIIPILFELGKKQKESWQIAVGKGTETVSAISHE